jgi:hypothetical protein
MKYSIEVYEDHAIIRGPLSADVLLLLTRLCKKEGFTHMTGYGENAFKLFRKTFET